MISLYVPTQFVVAAEATIRLRILKVGGPAPGRRLASRSRGNDLIEDTERVYNLGDHTLIITDSFGSPDAFELVAPVIPETADPETSTDSESGTETAILDEEETYRLYQCLHSLFHPTTPDE